MQKGTAPKKMKAIVPAKDSLQAKKQAYMKELAEKEESFMQEYKNEHAALIERLCKKYNGTITPMIMMQCKINE